MTEAAARSPQRRTGAVLSVALAVAVLLVLVPCAVTEVTNREPDPQFLRSWWAGIASTPPAALAVGSVGIVLGVSTAAGAVVAAASRRVRRSPVAAALVVLVVFGVLVAALTAAVARVDGRAAAVTRSLSRQQAVAAGGAAPQAVRAIRQALGLPGIDQRETRVIDRGSAAAGPLVEQTVDIDDPNGSDEYRLVTVGTLVDPVSGRVVAAWFFGL